MYLHELKAQIAKNLYVRRNNAQDWYCKTDNIKAEDAIADDWELVVPEKDTMPSYDELVETLLAVHRSGSAMFAMVNLHAIGNAIEYSLHQE